MPPYPDLGFRTAAGASDTHGNNGKTIGNWTVYGVANEWDPQQPMVCRPGDYISFYYTTPATDGFQPSVTMWLRHDLALDSGLFPRER